MKSKIPYGLFGLLLCASGAFAADIPDYPFVFVIGKADNRYASEHRNVLTKPARS